LINSYCTYTLNVCPQTGTGALPSSGAPNQLFTYSISYSCPGVVTGGTCAGATVTDPLPRFIDIDGNTRQLTFVSAPLFDKVLWKAADGSGTPETLRQEAVETIGSWSHDGRLAFTTANQRPLRFEIGLISRSGSGWASRRYLPMAGDDSTHSYSTPRFSPDGRWVAYNANESGRWEVYLRAYPGGSERTQVSVDGGYQPVWSRDGRELFYRNGERFYAVRVVSASPLTLGPPRMIFSGLYLDSGRLAAPDYDVSHDGRRFLVVRVGDEERAPRRFHLVRNWFEELKVKVPDTRGTEDGHGR
jgi:hypothetical protein